MSRFPSREEVFSQLAGARRGATTEELSRTFGIEGARRAGFERYLDNLVLQGALEASGDRYVLPSEAEAPGSRKRASVAPTSKRASVAPTSKRASVAPTSKRASVAPTSKRASVAPTSKRASVAQGDAPPRSTKKALPESVGKKRGSESIEGTVSVNARGFGFVNVGVQGDDIFIPAEALAGSMHGDRVVVQVVGRSARGREGVIVEIRQRGRLRAAGILRRRGRSAWVEPDDTRVRGPIVLRAHVDQGPEGNSGTDGDLCIVQITRYPESQDENPEGVLLQVLGRPGTLSVEAQKIIAVAGIEEVHSDEAIAEAEAYGVEVPKEMLEGREDFTHIPLPTIDPEDARDHDDAVWVERTKTGYRAYIAIADVSSYVREGTKLDEEARARGCSVYLPDRAIPMLPRALSSNLCSLLPDVLRLCLCVVAELDAKGELTSSRVARGFMRSAAKLTYGGVARALKLTDQPPRDPKAEAMVEDLKVAQELSLHLRKRRMARGALDFNLPEPKIIWSEEKEPAHVVKRTQDEGVKKAYQLIEELMLLGNEVVAGWLVDKKVPSIFRVHLPPDETKLLRLAAMCEILGVPFDIDETREPRKLAALVRRLGEHEKATVLHMLLLRSMKQATYEPENLGHFGLASQAYLHFTSPIRRYPDLVVHRAVHRILLGQKVVTSQKALEALAEAATLASQAERKSMEVEREVLDLYRAFIMKDRIGETFVGNVTGFSGSGAFVALDEPFVDVLVRFDAMGSELFELDDDGLRAVATRSGDHVSIGDTMTLAIADVSLTRHQILGRRIGGVEGEVDRSGKRGQTGRHTRASSKGKPTANASRNDGRGRKGSQPREGSNRSQSGKGGKANKRAEKDLRRAQKKLRKIDKRRSGR
jgi:ribonuclease R